MACPRCGGGSGRKPAPVPPPSVNSGKSSSQSGKTTNPNVGSVKGTITGLRYVPSGK